MALKLGSVRANIDHECSALQAWGKAGTAVRVIDSAPEQGALLLERLNADRSLETYRGVEQATSVCAELLARQRIKAPLSTRPIGVEVERILDAIRRNSASGPPAVPKAHIDRAEAVLREQLSAGHPGWLLHFDAHYLNVLRTTDDTGWKLIDPMAYAGPLEWEPIPMLRNRWTEAAATGNPAAALRRRLDIIVEGLSLDRQLAINLAHAVAVDNLLWLLPRTPRHPFVEPYLTVLDWA